MQSFFDRRGPKLDTSLPSVRHLQDLIRNRTQVIVTMMGGQELQGTLHWQDSEFLALRQAHDHAPVLLNRHLLMMLRSLT